MSALKVLLVEDNPGDALLVEEDLALDTEGFRVARVETLAEARDALETRSDLDAVVLDLGLPDSVGLATVEGLVPAAPEIPIVVLTGDANPKVTDAVVRAGADDFVPKQTLGHGVLRRVLRFAADRRERARELEGLRSRVARAERLEAIGRLAGGVAHDFNNVITAILATVHLLEVELGGAPDQVRRDLGEIRDQGLKAQGLARQLLAFGRRQRSRPKALELGGAVRGIHSVVRQVVGERIEVEFRVEEPVAVVVDPLQLEQVVLNLVMNARDAMQDGGHLSVTVDKTRDEGAPYARLRVADTGTGMSTEVMEHAFDPFFTTKELGEGTGLGLGLSTVYGIVSQVGGRVDMTSEPGKGTAVDILLPVVAAKATEPEDEAPPRRTRLRGRALLLDDEDAVRRSMKRILIHAGMEVDGAANADEALSLLEGGGSYDVLVSDVIMRGRTGPALVREMNERGHDLPVLFVSGYSARELERHDMAGRPLLQKPFEVGSLIRAVGELLADAP